MLLSAALSAASQRLGIAWHFLEIRQVVNYGNNKNISDNYPVALVNFLLVAYINSLFQSLCHRYELTYS